MKRYSQLCWPKRNKFCVLVLAGVELIFTVAGMGLCFGFAMKTVLRTQGCFPYCFSASHSTPPVSKSWERTQLRQLTPSDQMNVLHHAQHINLGEKEEEGEHSE